MSKQKKKIFVLDTNVILHDSSCINEFEENDVVIPITVLEELDKFKKGNETLNYHAREFVRTIDELSGDKLFKGGLKIGPNLGKIIIKLENKSHDDLKSHFDMHKADHQILNTAHQLSIASPHKDVILITKDVNLRMKAKSIGLLAQDYKTDHIKDLNTVYSGSTILDEIPEQLIQKIYSKPYEIDFKELKTKVKLYDNEYLILRNGKKSALAIYKKPLKKIKKVDKMTAYGISPRNAEQTFALDALLNPDIRLITLSGKAGTGKTLLALAAGLENMNHYRQIYMARPIIPLSNRDLGFLPGDVGSKMGPYMQPLFDNLEVIRNQFSESTQKFKKIKELQDKEKLIIAPLSYIRGRSLSNIYFIVDESQNLTPHEIKTIITRAGGGTKIVFTGDVFQIDHPYLNAQSNGLSYLIEKMHNQKIYAHINLKRGERSELAELASNLL